VTRVDDDGLAFRLAFLKTVQNLNVKTVVSAHCDLA